MKLFTAEKKWKLSCEIRMICLKIFLSLTAGLNSLTLVIRSVSGVRRYLKFFIKIFAAAPSIRKLRVYTTRPDLVSGFLFILRPVVASTCLRHPGIVDFNSTSIQLSLNHLLAEECFDATS